MEKRQQNKSHTTEWIFSVGFSRARISLKLFHKHKGAKKKWYIDIVSCLSQVPSEPWSPEVIQIGFQHQIKNLNLCFPVAVNMWINYPSRYWKFGEYCPYNIHQWNIKNY